MTECTGFALSVIVPPKETIPGGSHFRIVEECILKTETGNMNLQK